MVLLELFCWLDIEKWYFCVAVEKGGKRRKEKSEKKGEGVKDGVPMIMIYKGIISIHIHIIMILGFSFLFLAGIETPPFPVLNVDIK